MSIPYQQKDLGYKRVKTKATIRLIFQNSEKWDVPLQAIADSRDKHYKDDKEDTVKSVRAGKLDDYEFQDWLSNNMNWSDVSAYAVKVQEDEEPFDYESDFFNCEKRIEGKV